MPNKMPYTMRAALAGMLGPEQSHKVFQEAMTVIGADITRIFNKYGVEDLPVVLAVMQSSVNSVKGMIGPSGNEIMDYLIQRTACIAMPVDIIKDMKEEKPDE